MRLTPRKASKAAIGVATILIVYSIYQYVADPSSDTDQERKERVMDILSEEKHPGGMVDRDQERKERVMVILSEEKHPGGMVDTDQERKERVMDTLSEEKHPGGMVKEGNDGHKPGPGPKLTPGPGPRVKHVPVPRPRPKPQQPLLQKPQAKKHSARDIQMERSHNKSVAKAAELSNLKQNCQKHMGHYGYSIAKAKKSNKGYTLAYVDSQHFIINMVPFSGDRFWKIFVLGVQGYKNQPPDRIDKLLHHMSSLDKYGFADRLMSHKKVLLKRNPLKRMIAAYKDAFEGKFIRAEIQEIRSSINVFLNKKEDATTPVTFSDFISYVSSSLSHPTAHRLWGPVAERVLLCDIEWDYTYCADNHYEDYRHIRSQLRLSKAGTTPRLERSDVIPDNKIAEYFTTVNSNILQKFYKTFELDFKLLDYKMPSLSEIRLN